MRRLLNFIELFFVGLFFSLLWLCYRFNKIKPVRDGIWLWRETKWRAWKWAGKLIDRLPRKERRF